MCIKCTYLYLCIDLLECSKVEGRLNTKMHNDRRLNEVDFINRYLTTYISVHMKLFFLDKNSIVQFGGDKKSLLFI